MSSTFQERKKQQEELQRQKDFFDSFFNFLNKNKGQKPTRTIDEYVGNFLLSTSVIPVYRTDHYIGTTEKIEDGIFQYSRYTAIIGGVRISADDYLSLMKILSSIL